MRWTLAMPAQLVKALLGRALRVTAVARRHDTSGAITPFGVGHNATTQVEFGLAFIEVGIVALAVGLPQVYQGTSDRLPLQFQDLALDKHRRRDIIFGTIIHTGIALTERRAGYIQRPFNRARSSSGAPGFGLPGIVEQIQKVLHPQARYQQPCFVAFAETVDVFDTSPEFIVTDVQLFNEPGGLLQDT